MPELRYERMFRFALVDADSAESLGVVAFARPDFKPGLPVLVVELATRS